MRGSKSVIGLGLLIVGCVFAISCTEEKPVFENMETYEHEDGTYRGSFIDRGIIQVNIQFILVDGVIREATFRHLQGIEPPYHSDNEDEPYKSVIQQYEEALQYLVGKPVSDHLVDLYEPGDLVETEVDGYTGATIRSKKIISSIRDALSRGVYRYSDL